MLDGPAAAAHWRNGACLNQRLPRLLPRSLNRAGDSSSPHPFVRARVCGVCSSLFTGIACRLCYPRPAHPPVRALGGLGPALPVLPVFSAPAFTALRQNADVSQGAMAAVATNTSGDLPASGARLEGSSHVFPPNSVAPNDGNVAVVATGGQSTSLSPKAHAAPANEEKELPDPQTPNEETLAVQPMPPIGTAGGMLPDTTTLPASNGLVEDDLDPGQDLPVVLGSVDNEVFPSLEHGFEEFVPAIPAAADIQAQWMAYAKLEFEDGDFYMTTYAIELGRDITASRIAQRHELEERERQERDVQGLASVGDASYASVRASGEGSISAYHSHVSESGGIVGRTDENTQHAPRRRKKGQKSRSTASSRQPSVANVSEHAEEAALPLPDVFTIGPVLDPLLPDPNKCPLIPIHPPEPDSSKGISRRHARIEYNSETRNFELTVLGKNGVFLDDVYYHQDEVVPLQDKSRVQIGKVNFNFRLPNYPTEEENEDEELGSISGRMSFAFEDGRGDSIVVPDDESEVESEVVARSIEVSRFFSSNNLTCCVQIIYGVCILSLLG